MSFFIHWDDSNDILRVNVNNNVETHTKNEKLIYKLKHMNLYFTREKEIVWLCDINSTQQQILPHLMSHLTRKIGQHKITIRFWTMFGSSVRLTRNEANIYLQTHARTKSAICTSHDRSKSTKFSIKWATHTWRKRKETNPSIFSSSFNSALIYVQIKCTGKW